MPVTDSPDPSPGREPVPPTGHWLGVRRRWWLATGLSIVVGLVAVLYLVNSWTHRRVAVGRELQIHAELKTRQIADWRTERLGEARFLSLAPGVATDVAALLAAPDSPLARQRVVNWLAAIKGGERYESALLIDAEMRVRAAVPEGAEGPGAPLRDSVQAALADGRIRCTDLHRASPDGDVHLEVLAPIFPPPQEMPRGTPPADGPTGRPVAVAVLRVRPEHKLFPLIVAWPTPSETAESILVRIEGGSVLQLSEARHRPGRALDRRRPVAETRFAPGVNDEERRRPAEWIDYRGEPVLTVMLPVPDTSWYLISKIDLREAYAPLRRAVWQIGGVAGLCLGAIWLAIGYAASRRDRHQLREALLSARDTARSSERQALLSHEANDLILLFDNRGHIVEANPRALAAYGYTPEEMRRLNVAAIRAGESRARAGEDMRHVADSGQAVFEAVHVRKDGSSFPVEVNSRLVTVDGRPHFLSVVRDITERRRTEEAQRERARTEDRFAKVTSSVPGLVYSFRLTPDGRMSMPFSTDRLRDLSGVGPEEVRDDATPLLARIAPADLEEVRASILASARHLWTWTSRFRFVHPSRGVRWIEGQSVPQREPDGGTLWHGYIHDVTEQAEHRRALEESEERLRLALAAANQGLFDFNLQTGEARVSPEYATMLGYDPATFVETMAVWAGRLHPDDRERTETALRDYVAGRLPAYRVEFRQRTRPGGWKWILSVGRIVGRTPGGEPLRMLGTHTDIMHQKMIEAALREGEERLRLFVEHAPAALAMFDRDMRYLTASRRWRLDYHLGDRRIEGESHYLIFPEIGEPWKAVHRRGLAGEVVINEEDRFERADGTVHWLRWEVRPWRDGFGAIGGIMIYSEDISARKETECALAAQLAELQRWHAATMGRESRVLELKAEVNELLAAAGRSPRYSSPEPVAEESGGDR
jgi:PAS domain S-box-containing protein